MNLSEPLAGIAGEVEAAALRVLARADAGFSGRQVHQLAGVGSTSSVHRALTSLVRVGIVAAERRPPSIIYRMNREHVLWPVVESGVGARARVFESLDRFCAVELPQELELSVVIYGSVARRESTLDSDIDLFIVYPDGLDSDAQAEYSYRIAEHAERITGNEAQVFAVDRAGFARLERRNDALVANVLVDGLLVHGPPLPKQLGKRGS